MIFFYYFFFSDMNEKFQADSDCGCFRFSNDKYKHNWENPFEVTYDILIKAINGTLKTCQKESRGFWRDNILSWPSLALSSADYTQPSDRSDWVVNNYMDTSCRFDHREYRIEFSMRAMRSTEIVVTDMPFEKKTLGGKRLPHTNLYLKYFREKFYSLNSSLESFMLPHYWQEQRLPRPQLGGRGWMRKKRGRNRDDDAKQVVVYGHNTTPSISLSCIYVYY